MNRLIFNSLLAISGFLLLVSASSCQSTSGNPMAAPVQSLPVITINNLPATTYQEFSATLEGSQNVEIRPQVEGYIDKILVDEGAYVQKGTVLFRINDRIYREQLNNAKAVLAAAKANLANAEINVSKLAPLVKENIVSDVQLRAAQSLYDAAKANVAQAEAGVQNASINLGYTVISAPSEGYVGRIPFKTGSLVGLMTTEPLTVLSSVNNIRAYFSFSEKDFLEFKEKFEGGSIEEKIKQMPEVELVLADGSVYPQKGKVEIVSGQFDNSKGTISFRASFPNANGLLRSGNSGRIRIPDAAPAVLVVPKEATFELQDKVFVFTVGKNNTVLSKPVIVANATSNYYLLKSGLEPGEKIVYSGLDRLKDGAAIQPQPMTIDSLLKVHPL